MTKKIILSMAIATTLLLTACNNTQTKQEPKTDETPSQPKEAANAFNLDTTKLAPGQIFYQCDMHPEVLSDKQAPCPKCNMDLTEITKK